MSERGGVAVGRLTDTAWMSALPIALNVVSVVANGFIIRTLSETGYGSLVVATGLTGVTTLLANLGLRALYAKKVAGASDDAEVEHLLAEQLGLRLVLAAMAGVLAVGAARLLFPTDTIVLACTAIQAVGLVIMMGWTVFADILNARERFRTNASIAFAAGLILTIVSVAAAAAGGGAIGVAAAYLIGPTVNLLLQLREMRRMGIRVRLGGVPTARYRALLRESRTLAANDVLTVAQDRLEGVWAPPLFGKGLMAVHSAGMLPAERMSQAYDGAATAYFPAIAAAHARGETGTVRSQVVQMFTLILAIALPMAIATWFGAPYLAALLFPEAQQLGSRELATFVGRTSALGIPLGALGLGMRYALQATGQHSRNAKDQMAATLIGACTAPALAWTVGIRGLAVAYVVKVVLARGLQELTFRRHFPGLWGELPWRTLLLCSTSLLAVMVVSVGGGDGVSLLRALAFGGIGAAIYAAMAWRLGLVQRPRRDVATGSA